MKDGLALMTRHTWMGTSGHALGGHPCTFPGSHVGFTLLVPGTLGGGSEDSVTSFLLESL